MLQGVRMVFSGVIPVSGPPADPRTHRLWRMAETHGATVDSTIGPHTTHVVAVRLGTAKVCRWHDSPPALCDCKHGRGRFSGIWGDKCNRVFSLPVDVDAPSGSGRAMGLPLSAQVNVMAGAFS